MRVGRWLHAMALPAALAAVSLLPRQKGGPGRWPALGRGAGLWAASTLAGIALPACLGAARVLLTGECSSFTRQDQLSSWYAKKGHDSINVPCERNTSTSWLVIFGQELGVPFRRSMICTASNTIGNERITLHT